MRTWEQCISFFRNNEPQTEYERSNGISAVKWELLLNEGDLKIVDVEKSDSTHSLYVCFRVGINSPYWFIWAISEVQAQLLIERFPKIYLSTDQSNKVRRAPTELSHYL